MAARHRERHRTARIGWLRAAVLGADDGIVSTASLILGVAAAHASRSNVLLAGAAGLVAGAMSMAAGEYVSVHSQADTEKADIERERKELKTDDAGERKELTAIYVARGLDPALAKQVVDQLMAHDALGAHVRDELGISQVLNARPTQAALASAASSRAAGWTRFCFIRATKVNTSLANASDRCTPANPPSTSASISASTLRITIDSWKPSSSKRSGSAECSRRSLEQKL